MPGPSCPADVAFSPGTDGGSHAFSAVLITAGVQTLSAADIANAAIHCDTSLAITPGAPKLVVRRPSQRQRRLPR